MRKRTEKYTNQEIDAIISLRMIQRLDEYNGMHSKIRFKCLKDKCDYIWQTSCASIINAKTGCPKCAGHMQFNNDIIDERLLGRNIKRIDNYVNVNTKILFNCLICNNFWQTRPSAIFRGSGCSKCARLIQGPPKLNNDIVDERLKNRNIKRIDNYIDIETKINFQCLECNFIWSAQPDNILNLKRGCPKCSGHMKLNNEIVDSRLLLRDIKRLSDFKKTSEKLQFQCLVCSYIWDSPANDVLNQKTGCPECSGVAKLTNEIIDKRLPKNIKRLDDYKNNNKIKIRFQCLQNNCNNIWLSSPSNILNGNHGCPRCSIPGKNEKLIFNLFKSSNLEFHHNYSIKNISKIENKNYRVDFYFNKLKLIIEYNGRQHYEPGTFGSFSKKESELRFEKQQLRDKYVQNFCINNNIQIIWIDGREYCGKKLEVFLEEKIIPQLNKDYFNRQIIL